jgi:MYXO-CTERM domain-containing protein
MWLELVVLDASGDVVSGSGLYDATEAMLLADPQLRTYEVKLGEGGTPSFHFIRNDTVVEDTRIPPEGFRAPADRDMAPVGRDYADGAGGFRHSDEASYDLLACGSGELTLRARLLYQSTTREYVEFLRDEAPASLEPGVGNWGERAYLAWREHGGDEPVQMQEATAALGAATTACPEPDAGLPDAGPGPDAGSPPEDEGGCACRVAAPAPGRPPAWPLALGVAALLAIRRSRSRKDGR